MVPGWEVRTECKSAACTVCQGMRHGAQDDERSFHGHTINQCLEPRVSRDDCDSEMRASSANKLWNDCTCSNVGCERCIGLPKVTKTNQQKNSFLILFVFFFCERWDLC